MPITKNRRNKMNKSRINKRRTMRKRKYTKRNHRGGNFGGNCPDPNYSIYNTNFLKLFPYKV